MFQLCVATLLVGVEVAHRAGLEEKLVTNRERFSQICKILADDTITARQRLEDITKLVEVVERYRFASESTYAIEGILGPARLVAKVLLDYGEGLDPVLQRSLEKITQAKRSADNYETLDALHGFNEQMPAVVPSGKPLSTVGLTLIHFVWQETFMYYYWVKEARERKSAEEKN